MLKYGVIRNVPHQEQLGIRQEPLFVINWVTEPDAEPQVGHCVQV